jgi:hypothetical protein
MGEQAMNAPRLYHYTCEDHGRPGIEPGGMLLPNRHPWLPHPLVWTTDLDVPHREALGLISFSLSCDRTAVRYEVHPNLVGYCIPWSEYARKLPHEVREQFESAPGTMPRHWWVAEQPLLALLGKAAAL